MMATRCHFHSGVPLCSEVAMSGGDRVGGSPYTMRSHVGRTRAVGVVGPCRNVWGNGHIRTPLNRMTDRHLRKHYLCRNFDGG